jgi:hypothetical protein
VNLTTAISILEATELTYQNQDSDVGRTDRTIESMLQLIDLYPSRHHAADGFVVVTGAP